MHTLVALLPLIIVLGVIYVIVFMVMSARKLKNDTDPEENDKENKEDGGEE